MAHHNNNQANTCETITEGDLKTLFVAECKRYAAFDKTDHARVPQSKSLAAFFVSRERNQQGMKVANFVISKVKVEALAEIARQRGFALHQGIMDTSAEIDRQYMDCKALYTQDIKSYSWNSIYFLFVVTGGIGVVIRLFGALWQTALGTSWAIVASIFVVLSYIALWQWAKQHETLQLLGYKYAANLQLQNLKTVDDEIASAGFGYAMKTSFRDRWYAWFRFLAAACALVAIFFKFDAISAFIGGFFGRKQSDKAEDTPSFTNITSCMSRF